MREVWKLAMIVRNNAGGPPQGYTEVWVDPDKILGMTKHPNTGFATLLIPQGMIDTVVLFDKLWDALPAANRKVFERDEAVAPDPREAGAPPQQPNAPLDSPHHSHHHT